MFTDAEVVLSHKMSQLYAHYKNSKIFRLECEAGVW